MVKYHGLARRYLMPSRFLMRPLLNGGTLARRGAACTWISRPELSQPTESVRTGPPLSLSPTDTSSSLPMALAALRAELPPPTPFSLVQASPRRLPRPTAFHVLETVDRALAEVGQTTAILLVVSAGRVFGASVGDSAAWLLDGSRALDLTENQDRKPLLGSGRAKPAPFGPYDFQGRVLLGSDGLFKYVDIDRIRDIATNLAVGSVPDTLVAAARLPSGGLQDDIAIIVVGQQAVEADGRTSS